VAEENSKYRLFSSSWWWIRWSEEVAEVELVVIRASGIQDHLEDRISARIKFRKLFSYSWRRWSRAIQALSDGYLQVDDGADSSFSTITSAGGGGGGGNAGGNGGPGGSGGGAGFCGVAGILLVRYSKSRF
jgi:hypothetical protein